MIGDMDIFRTTIGVENPTRPGVTMQVESVMVDTGSEYTWLPRAVLESLGLVPIRAVRFVTADGRQIERAVCFGNVYAGDSSAPDRQPTRRRGRRRMRRIIVGANREPRTQG